MIEDIDGRYSVSSEGDVLSNKRQGTVGGILKKTLTPTGYHVVTLSPEKRPTKVHRLVAKAFIPNPENKPFVNHRDGDKLNNAVENLEWVSAKENCIHARDNGLSGKYYRGEDNTRSVLTDDIVLEARSVVKPRSRTMGVTALARKYGVNRKTLGSAIRKDTWSHI